MLKQLENERRGDLVRRVGDADIEEWERDLDCIAGNQLELVRVSEVLDAFGDFGDHSRVDFDCNDLLASLKQCGGQVACPGSDFQDYVSRLDA